MKFLVTLLFVAYAAADVSHLVRSNEADAAIIKLESDISPDGSYHSEYETANGISGREQGQPKAVPGSDVPAESVQGQVRWTAPGGEVIELIYNADENGYQAQGSHIPTPHPIPAEIARSLEYIRAHPPKPE